MNENVIYDNNIMINKKNIFKIKKIISNQNFIQKKKFVNIIKSYFTIYNFKIVQFEEENNILLKIGAFQFCKNYPFINGQIKLSKKEDIILNRQNFFNKQMTIKISLS